MKTKLFYFLKTNFGISNKESRGFLLLTPFLFVFALLPYFFRALRNDNAVDFLEKYHNQLDSLSLIKAELINSPKLTFNPADTISKAVILKRSTNLIKIAFAEADSIVLQIVPGIGSGLGGRIIKYRERLGGFNSKNQLLEIYGLKPETIEQIWNYFEFSSQINRKIFINTVEIDVLSAHPYISYGEAKVLIAFRKQHGNYVGPDDLKKIKIFKSEWIDKIDPYLSFD
jgi:DNA uptake protein ComE-like DNA-binding protein